MTWVGLLWFLNRINFLCGNAGDFTTTIIWPSLLDLGFENPSNHAFEAQEYSGVDSQEPELVYQNNTGQASIFSGFSSQWALTAA